MAKVYLTNAFSLNMLSSSESMIKIKEVSKEQAKTVLGDDYTNAIGHADLASVVANDLGIDITANRITVTIQPGDTLVVAQYRGPRLAEGTTTLPDGATIKYYMIEVLETPCFCICKYYSHSVKDKEGK